MSASATPYGLRPLNLIGGQPYAGSTREYKVAANNSAAIYQGDCVVLSSAGQPSALATTSPVASELAATSVNATAGIVGVMVGARYVNAVGQVIFNSFLPANTITGGASDVWITVVDDPDVLFQIKGTAALGTFNSGTSGSGWPGAIGKNSTITFGSATASTGVSGLGITVGSNGATLAATQTLALRIVDVVRGTESDAYPEFIVKFNVGVHSYHNQLGV